MAVVETEEHKRYSDTLAVAVETEEHWVYLISLRFRFSKVPKELRLGGTTPWGGRNNGRAS